MADVDLTIELLNSRANQQIGETDRALGKLRTTGLQALQGMRGLDSAMDVLSGRAELSASSVVQLTSLLPLLSSTGPAGLAAAGIGAVAMQLFKSHTEAKKLKEQELAKELKRIEEAANNAAVGLRAYQKAIADGQSEADARISGSRAQADKDLAVRQKQLSEDNKRLTGELESLRAKERELLAQAPENLQALVEREQKLVEVRTAIGDVAFALAEVVGNEDFFVEATGRVNKTLDQTADVLKRISDLDNEGLGVLGHLFGPEGMISEFNSAGALAGGASAGGYAAMFSDIATASTAAGEIMIENILEMRLALQQLESEGVAILSSSMVGAFDAYADALDKTTSLNAIFAGGFDRMARNVLASTFRMIGQMAMVHVAEEIALAISGFANPMSPTGPGPAHLAAAAKWAGVAALAGVASGLTSVSTGGGGSRAAGSDPTGGGGRAGQMVHFTIIGNLDTESREDLLRQLREASEGRDL